MTYLVVLRMKKSTKNSMETDVEKAEIKKYNQNKQRTGGVG